MRFVVEKKDSYKKLDYFIKFFEDGHRCGYVKVPKNHPFHGKKYSAIPICCHGGLTFSAKISKDDDGFSKGFWIGFDCAHCSDGLDFDKAKEIFGNSDILDVRKRFSCGNPVRSQDFVEKECFKIVDQLVNKKNFQD